MLLTNKLFKSTERKEEKEKEVEWSRIIRTRDNWACVICGNPYKPNAHHIIPREVKEYKFDLDNGVTLCTKHHKFCRKISAHNAPLAFFMWLEKYRHWQFMVMKDRLREVVRVEGYAI